VWEEAIRFAHIPAGVCSSCIIGRKTWGRPAHPTYPLYLHNLDNTVTLRRLIEFYVRAHNGTIPHAVFSGQTPDEIYFGDGDAVVIDLAGAPGSNDGEPGGGLWRPRGRP
jgi:hypothetical protein